MVAHPDELGWLRQALALATDTDVGDEDDDEDDIVGAWKSNPDVA